MSTPLCLFQRHGQPVSAKEVDDLLAVIRQQGPDGCGVWCDGAVGLGHLALAETPEMGWESQPASLDTRIDGAAPRDIVISADVRLDNRAELAGKLRIAGELLSVLGDSQLLLAAYLRWGEECPRYLLGDFAFVIWDGPQRKLFCGRDPMGVKPLYTYIQPDLFLAAGDVRALVAHPQGPHRPNLHVLACHLRYFSFVHPTMTYLDGVEGLMPAHTLTVTAAQVRLQRYWFPDQLPQVKISSLESAAEELRSLLEDAVAVRLRHVHAIGAHMSGGLDSTTVAFLAARQLATGNESISTYSWQPATDDLAVLATAEYSSLAAALDQSHFDHTSVTVTPADEVEETTRDICLHHGEHFVYEPLVRHAAASRNVRVLLSGWGGDELISSPGQSYITELFWRGQWGEMRRFIDSRLPPKGKNPVRHYLGVLNHHVVLPMLPDSVFDRISPPNINDAIEKGAEWFSPSPELARELMRPRTKQLRLKSTTRAYRLALLSNGHLHQRMESWAASGADDHIVYRYPLQDRRLVEFAIGLPREAFVQAGVGRYLFRRAVANLLPRSIAWGNVKLEPVRVSQFLDIVRASLLPALNITLEHCSSTPLLAIEPLRRHIIQGALDPSYDLGNVSVVRHAIQLLGAGWQIDEYRHKR